MPASRMRLSDEEVRRRAAELPGWRLGEHLSKTFQFPDFKTALEFVNRVGAVAEEQGHHPDIHLGWGRVEVETWTHDAGGITEKDFQLARGIDQVAGR